MTSFDCLPYDVIYSILSCDNVSATELCHISSVSKFLNCVAKSQKLWKQKYSQTWPEIAVLIDACDTDWKNEYRLRYNYKILIRKRLAQLSHAYYHQEHISNEAFFQLTDISKEHSFGRAIVINELENIIYHCNSHLNLTNKYYAKKALKYVRHLQLESVWQEFLSQPPNQLSLLEGSCLISKWCQSTRLNPTQNVATQVSDITQRVLEKVKVLHCQHPVIKHGLTSSGGILTKSLWPPRECKQILYCLNHVMFEEMKFRGAHLQSCPSDGIFIDWVLTKRSGICITLGIIYASIAARLGVSCIPVNFPFHFFLKWHEHPELNDDEGCTFIDVADNGAFKQYKDLHSLIPDYKNVIAWTRGVPAIDVFVRMTWYVVEYERQQDGCGEDPLSLCEALELLCFLSPNDMEHKLLLARVYMHLGINVTDAIAMLQDIAGESFLDDDFLFQSTLNTLVTQKISRPQIKIKNRSRDEPVDVKFAVGMIMRHKKYFFRCVIYGWDYTCEASHHWMRSMGVCNLKYKDDQPFYLVLVEDGTNRYAAQENLEVDHEMLPIPHIQVGRYFESFHGSFYLLNEQTILAYPNDIQAREEALSAFRNSQQEGS